MAPKNLQGNGGASSTSADGRRSRVTQEMSSYELELLRFLKQKAIDAANKEDSGEGRLSSAFSASEARARSARVIPEHEDARLTSPKSMKQAEILEAALEMTRVHYMSLTEKSAPSPPPFQNYMTQWRFLQDSLNVHWTSARLSGEPPELFILGEWHGALGNWKYLAEADIGDGEPDIGNLEVCDEGCFRFLSK